MKKELKLFLLGAICLFIVILLMPNQVSAATTVTNEAELRTALENGGEVVIADSVEELSFTTPSSSTVDGTRDKAAIVINKKVTLDGNGATIKTANLQAIIELYNGAELTLEDVVLENTSVGGRCIDTRQGSFKLIINNSTLRTTKTSGDKHDQPLTIGGSHTGLMPVEINNSTITTGYAGYGIITFNPVDLKINNSKINAYGALYMKGAVSSTGSAGSKVTITGSTLTSELNSSEPSNSFATIVMEDNNIGLTVIDSKILASGTGTTPQWAIGEKESVTTGNTIIVKGNSELTGKTAAISGRENSEVVIHPGVTSKFDIPEEYLPEGTVIKEINGEFVVYKENKIIVEKAENGTITADKEKAIAGEEVTLTVEAAKGYKLKSILVTKDGRSAIEVNDNKFVMPNGDVTVSAEFESTSGVGTAEVEPEKDDTPKTGVETTYTVFAVIAVVSLAGLFIIRKNK